MRHSKHIIGWTVIALGVGWSFYDWFFVDNGPAYFAGDWRRLLLLAFISTIGGLAVLGFIRLPAVARQRLATASFAVATVCATWCCGYFIWQFVRLRSFLVEMGAFWILAVMGVGSLALLAFVWFSFWRYWRRTYAQRRVA
jgi:hypothetical protein